MSVDFEHARRRLAADDLALRGELDADAVRRLLEERARHLAASRRAADERAVRHQVVAFRRGAELFGVPFDRLVEVRKVRLCAVPGTPPLVQGMFQIRGSISCAIDLQAFFGHPEPARHDAEILCLVVESAAGAESSGTARRLGLRVDELLGPRMLFDDEFEDASEDAGPADDGRSDASFVLDVSRDLVSILDIDVLLARPELRLGGA